MKRRLYDLTISNSINNIVKKFNPHEMYQLRCPDCGFPVVSGQPSCSNCVALYSWVSSKVFYISGFHFKQSENPNLHNPVLHFLGDFAGYLRLKVSFFSKKCSANCNFCSIPLSSSNNYIKDDHLFSQLENTIKYYSSYLEKVDFVAFGNEGSILDRETFSENALFGIIDLICSKIPKSAVIELESRADLLDYSYLERIRSFIDTRFALKIGLETHNEYLRNIVLGKNLSLSAVNEVFSYCGTHQIPLGVFMLVKPDYNMSDEEAFQEALSTIEYLDEQAVKHDVSLMVRPNIMFPAQGTIWAERALKRGWVAPSPKTIAKLGLEANFKKRYCYFGLWEENKTGLENTIWGRSDYNAEIFTLFSLFNRTQSPQILHYLIDRVVELKDNRQTSEKFQLIYPHKETYEHLS